MYPRARELRDVLKPSPVKLHALPGWFRKRVRRRFDLRRVHYSIEQWLFTDVLTRQWLDHWGQTELPCGRTAFVSEPYLPIDWPLESVSTLAAELGIQSFVTTNSWWYPGSTIRIVLYEGPESIPFPELKRKKESIVEGWN
jgi:hypothetical protein